METSETKGTQDAKTEQEENDFLSGLPPQCIKATPHGEVLEVEYSGPARGMIYPWCQDLLSVS